MDELQMEAELARIRSRQRVLWWAIGLLSASLILVAGLTGWQIKTITHINQLKLRRLDIVDESGRSRVILGSPAPPPTFFGKVGKRDGPVSGILLFDATGTERGGYVTGDDAQANALLTLDAQGHQTVLLLAEPDGPTLLRLWNREEGSVFMGVSEKSPFLNLKARSKDLFSAPTHNPESLDNRPLFR